MTGGGSESDPRRRGRSILLPSKHRSDRAPQTLLKTRFVPFKPYDASGAREKDKRKRDKMTPSVPARLSEKKKEMPTSRHSIPLRERAELFHSAPCSWSCTRTAQTRTLSRQPRSTPPVIILQFRLCVPENRRKSWHENAPLRIPLPLLPVSR